MNRFLLFGAALSAFVAILHIGCIIFGASWYRFLGAGEQMALLADKGSLQPTFITSFIVIVLFTWSCYALSGAGAIIKLPLVKWALCAITSIYLIRGIVGFFLMTNPLGRSTEFWLWSSVICLSFGIVHLIGLKQVWQRL
ncbi:MAG: hypothetical protein MJK12_11025 [Colwellia sp.]|nr:hypothetical protein [Colwellia sp.]